MYPPAVIAAVELPPTFLESAVLFKSPTSVQAVPFQVSLRFLIVVVYPFEAIASVEVPAHVQ